MLRENRSETESLHRLISTKDTELTTERNVLVHRARDGSCARLSDSFSSIAYKSKSNSGNRPTINGVEKRCTRSKVRLRSRPVRSSIDAAPRLEKSNSEEKFQKLLDVYNKLREEHVTVLRRVRSSLRHTIAKHDAIALHVGRRSEKAVGESKSRIHTIESESSSTTAAFIALVRQTLVRARHSMKNWSAAKRTTNRSRRKTSKKSSRKLFNYAKRTT